MPSWLTALPSPCQIPRRAKTSSCSILATNWCRIPDCPRLFGCLIGDRLRLRPCLGRYKGKETGETALLRTILDGFQEDDLVVFDRYYCSYMMLALLMKRNIHVCTRLYHSRLSDFRRGHRLGPADHLVTWMRPQRPRWMSPEGLQSDPRNTLN